MNRYETKAQKEEMHQWLMDIEGTASDRKLPKGKRIGKGVISGTLKMASGFAGGFLGAGMGRWSLLTGVLATVSGEIVGSGELTSFGIGMMASNAVPDDGLGATDDKKTKFEKAKDRMKAYGKGMMQKLWLDKLIKKKEATKTSTNTPTDQPATNGMGEVKYYMPSGEVDEMDLRELEKYENEIKNSGENYAKKTQVQEETVNKENVSGIGDDDMLLGTEDERIY